MSAILHIVDSGQLNAYGKSACYKDFDTACLLAHKVDYHALLVDRAHQARGRCSLWWKSVPDYPGEKLGVIGHFYSDSSDATRRLLDHACEVLRRANCTLAVGPMDGNTWRRYRFVTDRGEEESFFLEPDNARDWPVEFMDYGFTKMAGYSSALSTDPGKSANSLDMARQRLTERGITLRALNMETFTEELADIYTLSIASFQNNFLYTPIDKDEFVGMYSKIRPYIQANLNLLAEHDGRLVGYLFGVPDLLQKQRGLTVDTYIIKTVAVDPRHQSVGLGGYLVAEAQRRAHAMGFKRIIHALMFDDNKSRNISNHYAKVMRRYSLYSKPL